MHRFAQTTPVDAFTDDYDSCVLVRTPLRAATDGVVARRGKTVYGP